MTREAKRKHECCPNAAIHLFGTRKATGYNWRLLGPKQGDARFVVPVIHCPWCGVELEKWRDAQDRRPKLRSVGAVP
jgi:hypothetical protein